LYSAALLINTCNEQEHGLNTRSKLFYSYVFFVLLYAAITLLGTPNPETLARYSISPQALHLIQLTVIIPLSAIWFAAFYGLGKMRDYTALIKRSKDGKEVTYLTKGIMILAFSLPITNIIRAALNSYSAKHTDALDTTTIIANYVGMLLYLAAFLYISRGARGLSELARQRPTYRAVNILAAVFIVVGVLYCYLVLNMRSPSATYYMPTSVALVTLVIPYLYTWFLGMLATYEMWLYAKKISGVIFKRGWSLLTLGISSIIITSILFQFLTTANAQVRALPLNQVLILVYLLLALMSVGYVLLALGAKRLRKIEEV